MVVATNRSSYPNHQLGSGTLAFDWRQIQWPWMTLNAKIGGIMDFLPWHKAISFTIWRQGTGVGGVA